MTIHVKNHIHFFIFFKIRNIIYNGICFHHVKYDLKKKYLNLMKYNDKELYLDKFEQFKVEY